MTTHLAAPTGKSDLKPGRYLTLDAMRGLAAMAVAVHHLGVPWMHGGYLAVDFFFALSGFVLMLTYADRLRAGWSVKHFVAVRLIRLYPLYLVGLLIGAGYILLHHARGGANWQHEMICGLPLGLMMLPSPCSHSLFPQNVPAWSLFFELMANIAMAAVLVRLSRIQLLAVAVVANIGLILTVALMSHSAAALDAARYGLPVSDGGPTWPGFGIGVLRTATAFCWGGVIAQWPAKQRRTTTILAPLACMVLVGLLMVDLPASNKVWFDLAFMTLAGPGLVWLGQRIEPNVVWARPAAYVGEVSYALYAINMAFSRVYANFAEKHLLPQFLLVVLYLGALSALSWLCVRYLDMPMRRWLNRSVLRRWRERGNISNLASHNS